MDISIKSSEGKFNFRVSAIIVNQQKLLIIKDATIDGWYLPGGRVHMGETVEQALDRELNEELDLSLKLVRPLWLAQSFFTAYYTGEKTHELSLYFLIDGNNDELLSRGQSFTTSEQGACNHVFKWIEFENLKDEFFNPPFLKEKILNLPQNLTLITNA